MFRLVVFRPFVGEILVGWISSCSEDGIKGTFRTLIHRAQMDMLTDIVRMGFFDDIFIPKEYLFEGCIFIPPEQAWIWRTEHDLYIDTNERIRFRIEQEIFTDQSPQGPNNTESADSVAQNGTDAVQQQQLLQNSGPSVSAPYSLIASCQAPGMGLVTWWD